MTHVQTVSGSNGDWTFVLPDQVILTQNVGDSLKLDGSAGLTPLVFNVIYNIDALSNPDGMLTISVIEPANNQDSGLLGLRGPIQIKFFNDLGVPITETSAGALGMFLNGPGDVGDNTNYHTTYAHFHAIDDNFNNGEFPGHTVDKGLAITPGNTFAPDVLTVHGAIGTSQDGELWGPFTLHQRQAVGKNDNFSFNIFPEQGAVDHNAARASAILTTDGYVNTRSLNIADLSLDTSQLMFSDTYNLTSFRDSGFDGATTNYGGVFSIPSNVVDVGMVRDISNSWYYIDDLGNFPERFDFSWTIRGVAVGVQDFINLTPLQLGARIFRGDDVLTGSSYDDLLDGFAGVDTIAGGLGKDTIFGGAGNDWLDGEGGNDVINGGAGADNMRGRAGNDIYVVDHLDDVVDESANGSSGIDLIQSLIGFSLDNTDNAKGLVENLQLIGANAISGAGNGLNNVLTGNGAVNALFGKAGNDSLNGAAGADHMLGQAGNDVYVVDNPGDIVNESDGNGVDTVYSSVSFNLANTARARGIIESLILTGTAAIGGTGNTSNNSITGNASANALNGGLGVDVLRGLGGNDTLTGGAGIDTLFGGANNGFFVLNAPLSASNRDVIADFTNAAGNNDTFRLENLVMPALGAPGVLAAAKFFAGAAAHDADDRIVYNKATGVLFYDANGSLAGGVTQLATVLTKPTLTSADFVVI